MESTWSDVLPFIVSWVDQPSHGPSQKRLLPKIQDGIENVPSSAGTIVLDLLPGTRRQERAAALATGHPILVIPSYLPVCVSQHILI